MSHSQVAWGMTEDERVTDEQIGRALRVVARSLSSEFDEAKFQWYARALVRDAEHDYEPISKGTKIGLMVSDHGQDAFGGPLERLVEMMFQGAGVGCKSPYPTYIEPLRALLVHCGVDAKYKSPEQLQEFVGLVISTERPITPQRFLREFTGRRSCIIAKDGGVTYTIGHADTPTEDIPF